MKNITEVARLLLNNFSSLVCTSEDLCSDHLHYVDDEFEIAEVRDLITKTLGVSLVERSRNDIKDRKVNNWTYKNVLVVQLDNTIEIFQDYKKV